MNKLRKIKTKEDFVYYVAQYKWFLSLRPAIAFFPNANVWENAYVVFYHANKVGDSFKVINQFAVRVSTMMAEGVFTEHEKYLVISTITFYGASIGKNDAYFRRMFKIPARFGKYFTLVGGERSEMTKEERDFLA
jgi:hypothetical protein